MSILRLYTITLLLGLLSVFPAYAQALYMDMSLEDLMNVTVTSMSKRAQSLQETAAAVHVITSDDLRRSGATSLPEALRMVPGFMVGQHDANTWAVSSRGRGFNPIFENKLLFLIDGRSKYCPAFGGVVWDSIDVILEDVDRIEVIRGPGSSVWGSNAVNGIVNVITKSSADTQGLMASALYGNIERGTASLRYGGAFTPENTWRVFAKYRNIDGLHDIDGQKDQGGVETTSLGFRTDLKPTSDSQFTLQGGATLGQARDNIRRPDLAQAGMVSYNSPTDMAELSLQTSWSKDLGDKSSISLQGFVGRLLINTTGAYDVTEDTMDLDFQHQFSPWTGHTAQWGLGIKHIRTQAETEPKAFVFDHSRRADTLLSAFIQDEIAFDDGRWRLTLGSKFEHNPQTGLEFLPNARLLWHATGKHTLWTAVSRPVRTPSIAERYMTYHLDAMRVFDDGPPVRFSFRGNSDVEAEQVLVWELGHRFSPSPSFFLDTTFFATWTNNLFSLSVHPSTAYLEMSPTPHIQVTGEAENKIRGQAHGLEVSANWTPLSWWRLHAWYSYLEESYHYWGDGMEVFNESYGTHSPRHQLFFRSSMDLPYNTELDIMTRYISELPGLNIPDYVALDARLGWKPTENMEIALIGKNLLSSRHQEITSTLIFDDSLAVERSCYLKFSINF